jgi:DNA-binding GntR family transcriptional regulator
LIYTPQKIPPTIKEIGLNNRNENGSGVKLHRYAIILDTLKQSIERGTISEGMVLTEGPIALIFNTSRAPVRKALNFLYEDGLIKRFEGRGFMVGSDSLATPSRKKLTAEMLDISTKEANLSGERTSIKFIFNEVLQVINTCITFGHFRINDVLLAKSYGVSRTVAREVLVRLQERGLVGKDSRSHWVTGPITAHDVREYYELRRLLEPEALKQSVLTLKHSQIEEMYGRVEAFLSSDQEVLLNEFAQIEHDLHYICLGNCPNKRILVILNQAQSTMAIGQQFFKMSGIRNDEPTIREHKLVLEHLLVNAIDAAASSLEAHLRAAEKRMLDRLKIFSVFPEPDIPEYLIPSS